ncbi:MAG: chromate resistance protein ChrB domain-containing protein [Candidatus Binatia bacterium]
MPDETDVRWFLLIHQIPPKPNYLRVKIWRRLQRLGAVAIKNSVYALPKSEQSHEDFQWLSREITEGGGDATLCEARFVDGLSDDQVEGLFQAARDVDYEQVAEAARLLSKSLPRKAVFDEEQRSRCGAETARLRRRLGEIVSIDYFGAPARVTAEGLVSGLEARIEGHKAGRKALENKPLSSQMLKGKTWVTRKGIHIDRMATAWVVRRFIDPDAKIKFVPAKGYTPLADEVRFDMFEAEFTHRGDCCSMEVLLGRVGIDDSGVVPIAEIVHDIDLKDGKFQRQETSGIARLIDGIAMSHKDDDVRLTRAAAIFDDLYEYFRRKLRS